MVGQYRPALKCVYTHITEKKGGGNIMNDQAMTWLFNISFLSLSRGAKLLLVFLLFTMGGEKYSVQMYT